MAPALLAVQLVWGWIALRAAEAREAGRPSFKVALVQPAISSDLAWDPQQANSLVQRLLSLNRQAASGSPDLTVWTETVVPWTYRADDDFLNELTAATRGTAMHSLIGLNTRGGDRSGHNSVYLLNPAGAVLGRYDKQELLAGAERPFPGGLMLPFRALSGAYFAPGLGAPLPTPWGKGGVLLCNEGTVPAQAAARAQAGASWLAVVGNDAWFAGNYVPAGHFYQCRLRAVENRKDLLVNINQGPSGVVRASGAISVQLDAGAPAVHEATVIPNSDAPPSHLVFQIFILVLLGTCHRFLFNPQTNPQNKHV
ncbi:MAG: hypothetical protein EOO11_07950 [Chitinophagaceae bacterium]|nr:MAG: hypothetical protein EOO11_07950 [Chitinophagaceae bacterium]